jgi:hypothetical protein
MGQTWFRRGKEYRRGQLGNAEAVGLALAGRRRKQNKCQR